MINPFLQFLIALALGTLIGLEREYANYRQRGHPYGGIRTFPLLSLFGALAAYLGQTISPYLALVALFLVGVFIIVAYYVTHDLERQHTGAATEVAGFLTFFLGMMVVYGPVSYAVMLAIIIALILHLRSLLHHFAQKITARELRDTLLFAVIAFVVLPFLPNKWYGVAGWELFNPYVLWLMVVFLSAVNFLGYALMRWFGERGTGFAGALGGIASSTAVNFSFAKRSRRQPGAYRAFAVGILLANSVMFGKILVEVFLFGQELFWQLLLPFVLLASISLLFAYYLVGKGKKMRANLQVHSPLSFRSALQFSLLFGVILALGKVAEHFFSSSGVHLLSIFSGIADVDAITISLAQLTQQGLALDVAGKGILLAALTNTIVKGGLVAWLGGAALRKLMIQVTGITIFIGLLIFLWW